MLALYLKVQQHLGVTRTFIWSVSLGDAFACLVFSVALTTLFIYSGIHSRLWLYGIEHTHTPTILTYSFFYIFNMFLFYWIIFKTKNIRWIFKTFFLVWFYLSSLWDDTNPFSSMHLGYRFLFLSKSSVAELNYSAFQAKSAGFCFFWLAWLVMGIKCVEDPSNRLWTWVQGT